MGEPPAKQEREMSKMNDLVVATAPGAPDDADLRRIFRERVKELLLDKGWNQSELARRADVGRDQISTYLRDNPRSLPTPSTLVKIARALGVSTNELLPTAGNLHAASALPAEMYGDEDGYRVKINIKLPFARAIEVLKLVQLAHSEAAGNPAQPEQ
jgi:transcriptional regulator with XRE-family HTH domain